MRGASGAIGGTWWPLISFTAPHDTQRTAPPQQLSMNRLLLLGCIAGSGTAFIAPPAASVTQRLYAAALAEDLDLKSWCESAGITADKFDVDSATVMQDVAALEVLVRVPRTLTLSAKRRKD